MRDSPGGANERQTTDKVVVHHTNIDTIKYVNSYTMSILLINSLWKGRPGRERMGFLYVHNTRWAKHRYVLPKKYFSKT